MRSRAGRRVARPSEPWRPYVAYFAARFRAQLQYRAAALAGVGTQVFFGLVNVMVLTAFYQFAAPDQPLTQSQAVSYVWIMQALLLVLPFRVDREIEALIRTGNVAYELARPVHLPLVWLARGIADRTAPVLLRAVPQFVFSIVILRAMGWDEIALQAPATVGAGVLAAASAVVGATTATAIGLVASATVFWTIAGTGTSIFFHTAIWLLSGVTIPLPLFPEWFQPVIAALPFRAMVDVPSQIYLGTIAGPAIATQIALQATWAVALFGIAWALINRGSRRVVVQGG